MEKICMIATIVAVVAIAMAMLAFTCMVYEETMHESKWCRKRAIRDFMLCGSVKNLNKMWYTEGLLTWVEQGNLRQYVKSIKVSDFEAKYDNLLDQIVTLSHGSIIQGRIKWWADDEKYAISHGSLQLAGK